jgi:hypothetical protein
MDNLNTDSEATVMPYPTPYADVNTVLHNFVVRIQAILGNHFRGMYLYGSLALGDFDPYHSDIDFIVVTDAELADDLFVALQELHARFDKSPSPWAAKIEAAYIPRSALHHVAPTQARYPQVEKGTALFKAPLEIGWIFQCYSLREHGVRVAGPDPRSLCNPIDPSDLRRAVPVIPNMWLEEARNDPSWLDWLRQRENQSFVVLTLCRLLYTFDEADVVSKPAAARWAQKSLDMRWAGLIERALVGQHEQSETPENDVDDTIAMIQYTIERSQQQQVPPLSAGPQESPDEPE